MLLEDLHDMSFISREMHEEADGRWIKPLFYTIDEEGNKIRVAIKLEQNYVGNEIAVELVKMNHSC